MNTQETNELQAELNDLAAPQETQSVEIHVEGFVLFAETLQK